MADLVDSLVLAGKSKIVFLIMDGLGGLPAGEGGATELESAATPHLDALAKKGVTGLLDPIAPGITPGSGPAHLALFGYDPLKYNVGRGLLSAAGVDFPFDEKDLYARVNFATLDENGLIADRRAGRLDTETNARLCRQLSSDLKPPAGVKVIFAPEKEHRALLVVRGEGLREEIAETDPQKIGVPPLSPDPLTPLAAPTAAILSQILAQARQLLAGEKRGNMVLLRGFARYQVFPTLAARFGLKALAIATYPMYRGIARLLGMEVCREVSSIEEQFICLEENFAACDFFFVHIKATDSAGEDGNFTKKVKAIEEVDQFIPRLAALKPDVIVVTGDHSTPSVMGGHSWHPVPALLAATTCRPDEVENFGERFCLKGGMGRMPMQQLLPLALAHAGRLSKYGA